jgi:hypothetical protein
VASLLSAAVTAQVKGRLADQLQAALEDRWLIEQAKGITMGREELDAQAASERLRRAARNSTRRLADVAKDVTAGQPLLTNPRKLAKGAPSRPRSGRPPPSACADCGPLPAVGCEDGLRGGSHAACFVGPRLHDGCSGAVLADSAGLWPR